jgi:hypothetical protein
MSKAWNAATLGGLMSENKNPPKVFISYSWSSFKTKLLAMKLAIDLRKNGVDVILDRWHLALGQDMYFFMEQAADPSVSKFLVLCDREYKKKADSREGGVGTETQIITRMVYSDPNQKKVIPVVCERVDDVEEVLPRYLSNRLSVDISDDRYDVDLEELLRDIHGQPLYPIPEIGSPPVFGDPQQSDLLARVVCMGKERFEADLTHYVLNIAEDIGLEGPSGKSDSKGEILPALKNWACDSQDSPFAVLLGEYGMGKTWSSQLLAISLLIDCINIKGKTQEDQSVIPIPIYLDLRVAVDEKNKLLSGDVPELEVLLESLSRNNTSPGETPLTAEEILRAVREEGALLIMDGLDEVLAHKRDEAWGQTFIKRLFDVLPPKWWPQHLNPETKSTHSGKLLLTCRTHYFQSVHMQNDQILGLDREKQKKARPRAWQLLPFEEKQVLKYLELHVPERDTRELYELIASVHKLSEITASPQGVKMVCAQIGEIEAAKREGKTVNGATIYAWMVDKWLARDTRKHQLRVGVKRELMQDLALHMWQLGVRQMPWPGLEAWFSKKLEFGIQAQDTERLLTDLHNATFLVRPGEEDFSFAHASIQEYFLAVRLYRSLEEDKVEIWEDLNPSPEVLNFLFQHHQACSSQKTACKTLARHLGQAEAGKEVRKSWLDLYLRDPEEWPLVKTLDISRLPLEGYAFSLLTLDTLIADHADLAETQWSKCHFEKSSWQHANCRQMQCESLKGESADFRYADLFAGRWRNVSFTDLNLDQTFHHETLQRAPAALWWPPSDLFCCDWQLLWINNTGVLAACSMNADDWRMVTVGSDGTARVWNEKGECLRILEEHKGSVNACFMSADGRRMITAGSDGRARVWNEKGERLHVLNGHKELLTACSMSADGQRMTTCSNNTIRFWVSEKGSCKCTLELHPHTQTVIWLDAESKALKLKGAGWSFWQLVYRDDKVRNALGETIASFGPMAHEQLANANEWQFLPRDDIQPEHG